MEKLDQLEQFAILSHSLSETPIWSPISAGSTGRRQPTANNASLAHEYSYVGPNVVGITLGQRYSCRWANVGPPWQIWRWSNVGPPSNQPFIPTSYGCWPNICQPIISTSYWRWHNVGPNHTNVLPTFAQPLTNILPTFTQHQRAL